MDSQGNDAQISTKPFKLAQALSDLGLCANPRWTRPVMHRDLSTVCRRRTHQVPTSCRIRPVFVGQYFVPPEEK